MAVVDLGISKINRTLLNHFFQRAVIRVHTVTEITTLSFVK